MVMSDRWSDMHNSSEKSGNDEFDWNAIFENKKNSDISDDNSFSGTRMFEPIKDDSYKTAKPIDSSKVDNDDSYVTIFGDDFKIVDSDEQSKNTKKSKKEKKKKSPLRKLGRVLLAFTLVGVISVCLFASAFMAYIFLYVDDTVDNDLYDLQLDFTTILYATDNEGNEVEIQRLHYDQNRVWIGLDQIPEHLQNAYIAAEDQNFRNHGGVDWKRTIAAVINEATDFLGSKQGGSTITQQLVKNLTKDDATDGTEGYMRKIREIMRARYLEQNYYKDDILTAYLNTIHLGSGVDGVEVASYYYFDKHASELTLTQSAALAAITKAPATYDPYDHPEENEKRRNWVLAQMKDCEFITEEEYEAAKNADLQLRKDPQPTLSRTESVSSKCYSWFVDTCIEEVITDLSKYLDCTYKEAQSELYRGGYKIYTTQNVNVQKQLEDVFMDDDNFAKVVTKNKRKPQAAMTIMDYEGHIVGIVGGRGEKTGNRLFNRATNPRQTGSAIKPIGVYAPAIEYNVITYGSSLEDSPVMKVNGKSWPVNYTGSYSGDVTVLYALEQSLNTVPVRIVKKIGLEKSFEFVTKNMGISTYVRYEEKNGKSVSDVTESSLALGGATYGCTTTELTAAYVPFGNLGSYYEPTTYTKVTDHKGEENILIQSKPTTAISKGTAFVMNKMLQRVTKYGTGTPAKFGDWDIISKTGTTSDTKDRWFVGGTPYYVSAVWFGIDENEAMTKIYGINPALRLWKAAMQKIHKGLKDKEFPTTDEVVLVKYCKTSGMVANGGCSNTANGWFKKDYAPVCTKHKGSKINWSKYDLSETTYNTTTTTTTSSGNSQPSTTAAAPQQTTSPTQPTNTTQLTATTKPA